MTPAELARAVVRAMEAKGYKLDRGPGELNIVYVEGMNPDGTKNDDAPDYFNDLRTIVRFVDGQPEFVGIWKATTEPGKYYTQNPINSSGAARIQFGQYSAWQVGIHRNNHEALVQTGGSVTVCRDANKDYRRTGDKLDTGFFGINQHGPSGSDAALATIGSHSAGCLVAESMTAHRAFMSAIKRDPRYLANKEFVFRTAVLAEDDVLAVAQEKADPAPPPRPAAPGQISQAAIDLIVSEEVSDRAYYEKKYRRPEWPGESSGVTIGIGYDVGAGVSSKAQLHADWAGVIPEKMITALEPAIGVTGSRASSLAEGLGNVVDVPWDAAMSVFMRVDVPKWYGICAKALPNFELLSPDCKGALVSLAYNRGASFSYDGDRYREMRAIKAHMAAKDFAKIPAEFRSMKRIWAGRGLDGLLKRRDREADLFERGLKQPAVSVTAIAAPAAAPSLFSRIVSLFRR